MLLLSRSVSTSDIKVLRSPTTKLRSDYLEENMEAMWDAFVIGSRESGRKVWNSTLYRMESFSFSGEELELTLSTIDVKEIQMSMRVEGEYSSGERFRPYNMFVCSLLETSDGQFVFGETNTNTMSAGRIDLIGGALSHTESEVHTGNDIYEAALREIHEELNIDQSNVEYGYLRCLLMTERFNIGVVFHVRLHISMYDVRRMFSTRSSDEIVRLVPVDRSELFEFLKNAKSYLPMLAEVVEKPRYITQNCV